ncbi:Hpt domain-containing protein [bacterium 1XD42-94]|nr:Hpt domain-containing protein [bacterium 1XD42-76]NBK06755.1 Hpt domain-containing protein [bacterium 1XD42-94]
MQPEEDEEERTLPEEETWDEDSLEEYDPDEDFLEDDSDQINHSSADFAPLSKIGINVQLGMDYCCGEEAFYLEMLQMFCSQAPEKKAEIIALYENRNWKDYTVKVHALKSTSMTIGAERLAEQALLLEQAGKKGRTDYIRHNHPMLLRLYDEICETISGL